MADWKNIPGAIDAYDYEERPDEFFHSYYDRQYVVYDKELRMEICMDRWKYRVECRRPKWEPRMERLLGAGDAGFLIFAGIIVFTIVVGVLRESHTACCCRRWIEKKMILMTSRASRARFGLSREDVRKVLRLLGQVEVMSNVDVRVENGEQKLSVELAATENPNRPSCSREQIQQIEEIELNVIREAVA